MAAVYLFLPGEYIPAGSYTNTVLGEFSIVPREGWRMFTPQTAGNTVIRGRFVNKNANFTSLVFQISTPMGFSDRNGRYGAAAGGLEANTLTLNSTSVQNANTWAMPNLRIQANGTAGANDTDCTVALMLGFPVAAIICNQAVAGMPWKAGDDLLSFTAARRFAC